MLQNIDPIFIIQPAVVIVVCVALLEYWRRRRHFHLIALGYALLAYAAAIGLKYLVQIPTIASVEGYFGTESVGLGLYYGLQTMLFEVGLAYLVASWAVKKGKLSGDDAEGYGASLAFWENAVLLGALTLINYVAYYAILSTDTSLSQTVYNLLIANAPGLFDPPSQAILSVLAGTVERISSVMVHFAWGYLCILAVVHRKRALFLVALPMGLVDFLVPFAPVLGIATFEGVVFCISVASVVVAWYLGGWVRKGKVVGADTQPGTTLPP